MENKNYIDAGYVAALLKINREKLGLSQRELARKANVSNSSISRYEDGQLSDAKVGKLISICNVLNLNIAALFNQSREECR